MTKRRLSRRQAWRITKIQEERLQRAERKASRASSDGSEGDLGPEEYGIVIASFGASLEIEDTAGEIHRCALRQNLGLPVVGDRVAWQRSRTGGVVTAIHPRRSLLARPDASGAQRPLAANIDQILVVAAPLPRYDTQLIDHYLVAAECTGIAPVIVLNKIDLLSTEERLRADEDFAPYTQIGYHLVHASTRSSHGLDELLEMLRDKTSVFVGQSGVGKSSLARALLPEIEIRVGDLTEATGLGRHTTSSARLYHLPSGGAIIDSPGVREFQLWEMERAALVEGFAEFRPLLGECRFRDCRHESEPGCALTAAAREGRVSAARLESFRRIAAELEERCRPEWATRGKL